MANQTHRSSEHSFSNEPQNSTTSKRILLPLEPDFSQMLDPSIIIDQPSNTWQSTDRHTSQTRQSRRDQPKTKHKSKKRKRHKSCSSSSSSRSSSLTSHRRSKRSKRSKHSHKRRCSTSSSSSPLIHSMNDYGRYKRIRQSPQVADIPSMLQPARTIDEIPNIHSDNVVQQTSKDTGSGSEAKSGPLTGRLMKYLATSKLLLENSSYELGNAPINAKSLFDNKIKEVAKANYEAQQQ